MSAANQNNRDIQANILIVDDTPANISMLFNLLVEEGYKVLVAEDGQSAINQALKFPPDLVLLDILMPGMDGFATCQTFKKEPGLWDIPIIFMTALSDTEKKVSGFQHGAVDYITKPFEIEEVLARVATHLQIQKLKNALQESRLQLMQTINGAMDAILSFSDAGNIILLNQAAEKMFGYTRDEINQYSIYDLFSESMNTVLEDYLHKSEHDAEQAIWIPEQHMAVRQEGLLFPFEATLSRTTAVGQALFTLILRDIEARQSMELKTEKLENINQYYQQEKQSIEGLDTVIGADQGLKDVLNAVQQVAATDATVMVNGETGTGKEVIVQCIHKLSQRNEQALIKLNCAAIPENLIESELFGHEKGAFTGAISKKIGRFELADGGSLFLDEIGEMDINLQAKMLRILQEGEFERVGGSETIKVDVRLIAATHRDLMQCVRDGQFREDLYYRLNVFPVAIPALRERREDIERLAQHFLNLYAHKFNKPVSTISEKSLTLLKNYHWPGNVRELQHLIERAVILSSGTELMFGDWFNASIEADSSKQLLTLEEVETRHIQYVLDICQWRISGADGAADVLGLNASTLRSRMNKLGIRRE
ncbi:MAG: sigma-54-dependent Fis family transcriptional regulator [Gammaproteobacteria bacterium]|nr:sigma-54-dependent Fis family transcriptional regulator [Gammaproteobacteria bacterium]